MGHLYQLARTASIFGHQYKYEIHKYYQSRDPGKSLSQSDQNSNHKENKNDVQYNNIVQYFAFELYLMRL